MQDREDLQFLEKYINVNPVVKDIIEKISAREKYNREIGQWITLDIARMIQISQRSGIKILVQNYPNYHGKKPISHLNIILKEIAQKYSSPFVDNDRVFQELLLNGENKNDYFAVDRPHCNEKGYGIMAKNIYNYILKNKLIK